MDVLTWNVLIEDFNRGEIITYDVFCHTSFKKDVAALKRKKLDRHVFSEELRRKAVYYFWSKCEFEIVVASWPVYIRKEELNKLNEKYERVCKEYGREPYRINVVPDVGIKIDIYYQLRLNWDAFVNYCFEHKM